MWWAGSVVAVGGNHLGQGCRGLAQGDAEWPIELNMHVSNIYACLSFSLPFLVVFFVVDDPATLIL